MQTQTIEQSALAAIPRPVRIGTELPLMDQAHALRTMAPLDSIGSAEAWLSRTVFAVNRDGALDRRVRVPVATITGRP